MFIACVFLCIYCFFNNLILVNSCLSDFFVWFFFFNWQLLHSKKVCFTKQLSLPKKINALNNVKKWNKNWILQLQMWTKCYVFFKSWNDEETLNVHTKETRQEWREFHRSSFSLRFTNRRSTWNIASIQKYWGEKYKTVLHIRLPSSSNWSSGIWSKIWALKLCFWVGNCTKSWFHGHSCRVLAITTQPQQIVCSYPCRWNVWTDKFMWAGRAAHSQHRQASPCHSSPVFFTLEGCQCGACMV